MATLGRNGWWLSFYIYHILVFGFSMGEAILVTEKAKQIWQETRTERPPKVVDLNYTFDFGKYAGWRFDDVAKKNVLYIFWLLKKNIIVLADEVIDEIEYYLIYYVWNDEKNKGLSVDDKFQRVLYLAKQNERYLIKNLF